MFEPEELGRYLDESCRKYQLSSCAVVAHDGDVHGNAGDFISDHCLKSLPEWLALAYQMSGGEKRSGLSYASLSFAPRHLLWVAWRFELQLEGGEVMPLYVLLGMHHIPRHLSVIQADLMRDLRCLVLLKKRVIV